MRSRPGTPSRQTDNGGQAGRRPWFTPTMTLPTTLSSAPPFLSAAFHGDNTAFTASLVEKLQVAGVDVIGGGGGSKRAGGAPDGPVVVATDGAVAAADGDTAVEPEGWFAMGIWRTKTAGNHGTLWRSGYQMGASYLFSIGARYDRRVRYEAKKGGGGRRFVDWVAYPIDSAQFPLCAHVGAEGKGCRHQHGGHPAAVSPVPVVDPFCGLRALWSAAGCDRNGCVTRVKESAMIMLGQCVFWSPHEILSPFCVHAPRW